MGGGWKRGGFVGLLFYFGDVPRSDLKVGLDRCFLGKGGKEVLTTAIISYNIFKAAEVGRGGDCGCGANQLF